MAETAELAAPAMDAPETAGTFFKKQTRNKNMRKRPTLDEEAEAEKESSTAVATKAKVAKKADGRLGFSTGGTKATDTTESTTSVVDELKQNAFFYESTRQVQTLDDSRATAVSEIETAFDRDNRAIRERVLKQASEALKTGEGSSTSKVYKGIHGYTDHKAGFRQEHTISREKAGGAHGPLRASAHIRMTVRFDYQPDICKDYKETGYCGYGDSCKFMHDRGDYKSGWQMEREWDQEEKERKARLARGEAETEEGAGDDSDDEDALPFACFICREPFTDPVVTQCKHYFCEHCALKHHSRNKLCFVCNKATNGVFNTAHDIVRRQKEAKAAEAAAGD